MRVLHTYVGVVKNRKPISADKRPIPEIVVARRNRAATAEAEAAATRDTANQRAS